MLAIPMPQEFIGEYSYDGENWQTLTEESDISALEGDLYLRGTFLREMYEGWQLNFYRNHIGVLIKVNGQTIYQDDVLAVPDLKPEFFASMSLRFICIILTFVATRRHTGTFSPRCVPIHWSGAFWS